MANKQQAGASFDEIIQKGRRETAERLAQEMFGRKGSGGRSSAPPAAPRVKPGLGGSLASRVGVLKRTNSPSPRSLASPREPRARPHDRSSLAYEQNGRAPRQDGSRSRVDRQPIVRTHTDTERYALPVARTAPNGYAREEAGDTDTELIVKGAAAGPYVVVAQNFAPGTTAADIESVMLSVGGAMSACKLAASHPTVIAEMSFLEKTGAEKVIETFNGKKADGRPLYVYWKHGGNANGSGAAAKAKPPAPVEVMTIDNSDEVMNVDDTVQSREAQDRLREERQSRDDHAPREAFPTGPRGYRAEMDRYDDRRARRPEPAYQPQYQDGRYGYGGNRGGYRDSVRGGYGRDDRRYGGQSWR